MARAQPGLAHAHVLGFGRGPSSPEGYHSINTSILSLSAAWNLTRAWKWYGGS